MTGEEKPITRQDPLLLPGGLEASLGWGSILKKITSIKMFCWTWFEHKIMAILLRNILENVEKCKTNTYILGKMVRCLASTCHAQWEEHSYILGNSSWRRLVIWVWWGNWPLDGQWEADKLWNLQCAPFVPSLHINF